MAKELLYATGNKGKILEMNKHLKSLGVEALFPSDKGIVLSVPETGQTLQENAEVKLRAYLAIVKDTVVITDDTGLEIDALARQPGIYVRRWKDKKTELSDQEIIDYCLALMKGIPMKKRGAQFHTVLAVGGPDGQIEFFDGYLRGVIQEKAADFRIGGFPFESLFYVPEWKMLLGETHRMPAEQKANLLSHREKAAQAALPRIRELLAK